MIFSDWKYVEDEYFGDVYYKDNFDNYYGYNLDIGFTVKYQVIIFYCNIASLEQLFQTYTQDKVRLTVEDAKAIVDRFLIKITNNQSLL